MPIHRIIGAFVATLLACSAVSADAKPDLTDLRDAIAAADKKGENVEAIRAAFAQLQKALAKGATKADDAPPELTALRDAVEMALKKGENVEAVAKELARVEKALTGREYERPKTPEPPKEPEPNFQPMPGRGRFGGGFPGNGFPPPRRGGGMVIGPIGPGVNSTSVTISNGNFAVKARQNDVSYEISGSIAGDEKPKIVIRDGEKKPVETDDVKQVPEEYRATVQKLLDSVRRP